MYTIDLFKGKNVPLRSGVLPIVAVIAPLLISAVVGILVYGPYVDAKIEMPNLEQRAATVRQKIAELADVRRFIQETDAQKVQLRRYQGEVAGQLETHTIWSPVLVAVAQSVPPGIIVNTIEVKRENVTKKPGEVGVHSFVMKIGVYVSGDGSSAATVQQLITSLRLPTALGSKVGDIRVVLQQRDVVREEETTFYLLECVMKQGGAT